MTNMIIPADHLKANRCTFSINEPEFERYRFTIVRSRLPSMNANVVKQPFRGFTVPFPQDSVDYEDITFEFRVDEKMENWKALYRWLISNAVAGDDARYCEGTMEIVDADNQPVISFHFKNSLITNLSGLDFDVTDTQNDTIIASCTIAYSHFEIS